MIGWVHNTYIHFSISESYWINISTSSYSQWRDETQSFQMCAYFLSYGYVTWSKLKVVWRSLKSTWSGNDNSRYNENRRHLHMLMDVKLKLVCAFLAFWRAKIRQRGICISNTKTEFNAKNQIYNSLQSALRRNSFVMKRWRFYFYFRVDQIRQSTNKIPLRP